MRLNQPYTVTREEVDLSKWRPCPGRVISGEVNDLVPVGSGYPSGLTVEAFIALLAFYIGLPSADSKFDSAVRGRHLLYSKGLLTKTNGVKQLTTKGEALAEMIMQTPMPVAVTQPSWIDPRSK